METLLNALPWIVGGLILILLLAALRRPLEWLVRLAARTGVGLAALWALSGVGGLVGLHLGVNLVNALVLGVLGVPGFGLLLMLNWALGVGLQTRGGRCGARPSFAVRPAVGAFLQGGGRFIQRLFTHL